MQEENNKRIEKIEQSLNDLSWEVQRLSSNLRGLNEEQNQLMRRAILWNDLEDFQSKIQQEEITVTQQETAMNLQRILGVARGGSQQATQTLQMFKAVSETFLQSRQTKVAFQTEAYHFHWHNGEVTLKHVATRLRKMVAKGKVE